MRFEEALTSLREGYHVRRSGWNVVCIALPPGVAVITAFWQAGFSEPWRPTLEDIQAEDWLLFPFSDNKIARLALCNHDILMRDCLECRKPETRRLHNVIDEACKKLGM